MATLLECTVSKFRCRWSASLGLVGLVLFFLTCGVNSNNNNQYPSGNNGGSHPSGAYWQGIDQNGGATYPSQNGIIDTSQTGYNNGPNSNSVSGSLGEHTIEGDDDNLIAGPSQLQQYQQQQQSTHHHPSPSQYQPQMTDDYGNLVPSPTSTMIAGVTDRDSSTMPGTGIGIGTTMPATAGFSTNSNSIPPSPPQPQAFFGGSDLSQVDKDLIFEGLKKLYKKKVLPLEVASKYAHFSSPPMGPRYHSPTCQLQHSPS